MADETTYASEEERWEALRIEGQEAAAPDDFDEDDDEFEEVTL